MGQLDNGHRDEHRVNAGGKRKDGVHDVFVEPTSTEDGGWQADVQHLSDLEVAGLVKRCGDVIGEEAWKCLAIQLVRKFAQRTKELHAIHIELEQALGQIRALKKAPIGKHSAARGDLARARRTRTLAGAPSESADGHESGPEASAQPARGGMRIVDPSFRARLSPDYGRAPASMATWPAR